MKVSIACAWSSRSEPPQELSKEQLYRLMQANFESALDARYAVARGLVWSTFIHPLGPMSEEQIWSALAQTITLAATYGSGFTSGALRFGGGDGAGDDIYDGVLEQVRPRIKI